MNWKEVKVERERGSHPLPRPRTHIGIQEIYSRTPFRDNAKPPAISVHHVQLHKSHVPDSAYEYELSRIMATPAPARWYWFVPICAKRFYRHYNGKRHYSTGTI